MTSGTWVLLGAVLLALTFGLYRAYADGRFRGTHTVHGAGGGSRQARPTWIEVVEILTHGTGVGERATLVQFSTAFCAPCRAARRTLGEVAGLVPGVTHIEVDAESHLELVRALGILRTPTTIIVDPRGAELARASGAPTRDQVLAQLGALT